MHLWSDTFKDGDIIPEACAFGVQDAHTHVRLSSNRNPHFAWDDVPAGTESLILFCIDIDVPSVGTDVNQEGREVPHNLARVDFYHWSLCDIPPTMKAIAEGQFSDRVSARGKPGPAVTVAARQGAALTLRHGLNDYTGWFAGDPAMAGDYYGYDGPCPPWNDQRPHRYIFRIYALDIPRLPLDGRFSGAEAMAAIRGHILDEAQLVGVYSLHPQVAAQL
ncbi:YbhB/YbcL family Raf kinase inhibitor-like protein [Massilia sp. TS11]|uniref:YbhB/YbcL family Raf kinase inhibitor-like protein n=1 Tax=Massilia sp. TS11 TaxID=2908003 RepID=UPI001EDC24D9|nr:YbhB/YbcL family Raf kinase inhibitor-like protein [Massilia sp. TS11]MCG2585430.1 YbhB/YbcL family Raf kinase inhibitor-like protein [Massilia sp. TS11]